MKMLCSLQPSPYAEAWNATTKVPLGSVVIMLMCTSVEKKKRHKKSSSSKAHFSSVVEIVRLSVEDGGEFDGTEEKSRPKLEVHRVPEIHNKY